LGLFNDPLKLKLSGKYIYRSLLRLGQANRQAKNKVWRRLVLKKGIFFNGW